MSETLDALLETWVFGGEGLLLLGGLGLVIALRRSPRRGPPRTHS